MESEEEVRRRQKNEEKELEIHADKMRSMVPKKDRAGKQRVTEEVQEMRKKMLKRHQKELKEYGMEALEEEEEEQKTVDDLVSRMKEIYTEKKLSKQQQKRKKKELAERQATEKRELERLKAGPSERDVELSDMKNILQSHNLGLYEIPADGDCLFSAVAHQMSLYNETETAASLRSKAADHLLDNQSQYIFFVESVDGDEAKYRGYCEEIRDTNAWGGQVELRALAYELKVKILVYAVGLPLLTLGDENTPRVVRLSFHRKYYGLGEHYNSVVELPS